MIGAGPQAPVAATRAQFRLLARMRLADAAALLRVRRYAGAYYLCGYAVEAALKACICRNTRRYSFPLDRGAVDKVYTHDPKTLVGSAGLSQALVAEIGANRAFSDNWSVVKDWGEKSRYQRATELEARNLYAAVTNPTDGVLRWISRYW